MGWRWSGVNRAGVFRPVRRRPPTKFTHDDIFTVLRQLLSYYRVSQPYRCLSNRLPNYVLTRGSASNCPATLHYSAGPSEHPVVPQLPRPSTYTIRKARVPQGTLSSLAQAMRFYNFPGIRTHDLGTHPHEESQAIIQQHIICE